MEKEHSIKKTLMNSLARRAPASFFGPLSSKVHEHKRREKGYGSEIRRKAD